MNALRYIGSVFIAVLVGGIVIGAIQMIGMLLFPLPGDMTMSQFEAMTWDEKHTLLHAAPPVVFIPVLIGYLVGMVVAGAVATLLWPGRKLTGALIVGVLFTLINIANVVSVPQPLWVTVASFMNFLPGALGGGWAVSRGRSYQTVSTEAKHG